MSNSRFFVLVPVCLISICLSLLIIMKVNAIPPVADKTMSGGAITTAYRLSLQPGDLLLESIREFITRENILDGAVLSGIGSLSECRIHWVTTNGFPPNDEFETLPGPLEILSIQGVIADGEPHLHMAVSGGKTRHAGGHVEDGCKVLYLTELVIVKIDGPSMIRRTNSWGIGQLEKK
jgi:uncharacterized protein